LQNGRYAVLKKLGEGGKGVVYKARDTVLNRVVAIKILKSEVSTEETYSRFIREAQAAAKLNHPSIVSIHDIGKEDGKQFFVLEFVAGMSLRDLTKTYPEGKCDIQTALRIAIDICNALQYAHSQGVLHRDIKPENILITEEGTAKLMDFGLAKMIGTQNITQEGIIVGTVAYVAPEIALGKGADARSDLYSFGAVLYETVTGKPPFPGEDPVKVIFGHIHDRPVSPNRLNPKIPQALTDCIMKLLEKEPSKRYQSSEDLLKVLREIGEGFLREVLVPSHKASIVVPVPRAFVGKEIQLVDRVQEMTLLREAVDGAVRNEGCIAILHGEAGIGKTRLARELGAYARLRGMQVLRGRCTALSKIDVMPPYILWSEVIKDYLQACTPEQLYRVIGLYPSEVSKLVPEIKHKLGAILQSLPISPEQERNRLFEAVSQFITNISKEAPLMVVLDDLQWTDQSSLLLLHYLARSVDRDSLVLLGIYRDTDIDQKHPLPPILTDLNRERLLQSVPLKRLSLDEVSEMIRQILEQDDVPIEFCRRVYERTGGNPFFVEEVMKSLKEEGVIYPEENKWKIREIAKIEFPESVKSVLKARIGRLDEECQNALTTASFVGNDFTLDALRGMTGVEEDQLLETMEKILKSGLVKEKVIRGEDVYSFTDAVIRDVVHEEVSRVRHKKLHGVLGRALEKVYANKIDEHFSELALHFLESGEEEKALDYFLKAGERAQKLYAHNEAFSYFQHALELLEENGNNLEQRVKIFEKLGDISAWMGEVDAGMEYWDKSLALWNKLMDKKNVARLHAKMAWWFWEVRGNKTKAAEHHRMALEILEKEPESVELAGLYEDISHMLWRTGKSAEALPWAQKALKLAERLGTSDVLAWSYNDLGVLSLKSGESERAQQYYEQGLRTALASKLVIPAGTVYSNLCDLYLGTGELQKCFETAKEGSELTRKAGAFYSLVWIDMQLAGSYARIGEAQKALSIMEDIVALDKRIKNTSHLSYAMHGLGLVYLWLGEWDKSLQYLMEARDLAKESGEYQSVGNATVGLGELFIEREDYAEAEKYLNESSRTWEEAGDTDGQVLELFPVLSRLYLRKGEIEKAREIIEKTSEHAAKAKKKMLVSYTDMLKGMVFREQKDWQKSEEQFEKSLSGYKSLNAPEWHIYQFAELLYEYGLMYLDRNHEGDKEKAYSLLDQALVIYQKMDAKKKIEKILTKKKLLTA
jgi:tetratricopeptide (TPR) repeat protein/tRNA A-37 threonylcarbamoyl transferase component Bud32